MLVRVRGGGVEEDERLSGSEKARRPDPRQRTRHSRRLSVRSLPSPRRLGRPPRPPSSTLSSCAWQSAETSIPAMVRSLSNSDDACSIRASGVRDGHWVDASPRPRRLGRPPIPRRRRCHRARGSPREHPSLPWSGASRIPTRRAPPVSPWLSASTDLRHHRNPPDPTRKTEGTTTPS